MPIFEHGERSELDFEIDVYVDLDCIVAQLVEGGFVLTDCFPVELDVEQQRAGANAVVGVRRRRRQRSQQN